MLRNCESVNHLRSQSRLAPLVEALQTHGEIAVGQTGLAPGAAASDRIT